MQITSRLLCLLLLIFCTLTAQAQFEVKITQFGKEVQIKRHKIKLKKAPFELIIILDTIDFVQVNALSSDFNYNNIRKKVPHGQLDCFMPGTGMADWPNNDDKNLMLDKASHHYLYYDNEGSRFDKVAHRGGRYYCTRTVEQVLTEDNRKIQVSNYESKRLFLTFLKRDKEGQELKRDYLQIKFK